MHSRTLSRGIAGAILAGVPRVAAMIIVLVGMLSMTASNWAAAQSTMGPFRAFSWVPDNPSPVGSTPYPSRITPFVGVNLFSPSESTNAGWDWAAHGDPSVAAATLASRPAGQRVLFVYGVERFNDPGLTNLFTQAADRVTDPTTGAKVPGIWPTQGTARAAAVYDDYFSRLKVALDRRVPTSDGVDGLVIDMETNYSIWSMNPDDPVRWRAVESDPRFATVRATLATRHPDFNSTMPLQEIADYRRYGATNAGEPYLYWNSAMKGRVNAALNEAVYDPFRARFPGVSAGNYETARLAYPSTSDPEDPAPAVPVIPDANGHLEFFDRADGPLFGNTGAPTLYGWVSPNIVNSRPEYTVGSSNPLLTAFGQVIVAANMVRGHVRATVDATMEANLTPWIAPKSWAGGGGLVIPWHGTAYYDEMVYQAALSSGKTNFMYWNTRGQGRDALGNLIGPGFSPDDVALSDILEELYTRFNGIVPVAPVLVEHVDYADPFLVGAVRFADGSIVGRVTFSATNQIASFTVGGTSVTVDAAGQVGQWFSVTPVPEPSTFGLAAISAGCCAAGAAWRRRRRMAARTRTNSAIPRRHEAAAVECRSRRP